MHALFKLGDVFRYSRSFNRTISGKIVVEKECELIAIIGGPANEQEKTMTFRIPPGRQKHLSPIIEQDTLLENVSSLSVLETACLDIDGQLPRESRPNGNSWKVFRLQRKSEDAGSLFEIRAKAFVG